MGLDWEKILHRASKFARWAMVVWAYGTAATSTLALLGLAFLTGSNDFSAEKPPSLLFGIFLWLIPLMIIAFTIRAVSDEKERVVGDTDSFRGGNLFFRYGEEVVGSALPMAFDSRWPTEKIAKLTETVVVNMSNNLQTHLPDDIHISHRVAITNQSTGVTKTFLRLVSRTSRGSLVAHFFHIEVVGGHWMIHSFVHARGLASPADQFLFALESPVRIWFWFLAWKLDRYSILNRISSFDNDSYDLMDLRTRHFLIGKLLWAGFVRTLKGMGLLTAESERMIINHFHRVQQVNIGSRSQRNNFVSGSAGAMITQVGSIQG